MGKYKKIADLYVTGRELVFKDGSVMWVRVLNEFERADCRRAAQAARGKLVMALREEDTPDWVQMRGFFYSQTSALTIEEIINGHFSEWYLKISEALENDPDWREKLEILKRSDEATALPEEDPERRLVEKLNAEYVAEITKRLDEERDYLKRELGKLDEDELLTEYKDRWIERRGAGQAMVEYALWELYHAARDCSAKQPDGRPFTVADHADCNHAVHAFDDIEDMRDQPDEIKRLIRAVLDDVALTEREAKNSDRSLSSSVQSQGPEQPEESQPSIPQEVELQPLGPSPLPSPTH